MWSRISTLLELIGAIARWMSSIRFFGTVILLLSGTPQSGSLLNVAIIASGRSSFGAPAGCCGLAVQTTVLAQKAASTINLQMPVRCKIVITSPPQKDTQAQSGAYGFSQPGTPFPCVCAGISCDKPS